MDKAELERVRCIVKRGEELDREISSLRDGIKKAAKLTAVQIRFGKDREFDIAYRDLASPESDAKQFYNWCSDHYVADLSERFREAFIAIVQERLNDREREYNSLSVASEQTDAA